MTKIKVKKYGKVITIKALGIPWETQGRLFYKSGQMINGVSAVESVPIERVISVKELNNEK